MTTFEWRSEGFDETAADWLDQRDAMNQRMLEAFRNANREQPVDAVVGYLSGHTPRSEILQAMARGGGRSSSTSALTTSSISRGGWSVAGTPVRPPSRTRSIST